MIAVPESWAESRANVSSSNTAIQLQGISYSEISPTKWQTRTTLALSGDALSLPKWVDHERAIERCIDEQLLPSNSLDVTLF